MSRATMINLQLQLFGDFRLVYGDTPVTAVNQGRLQSLLAYLVLHREGSLARRRLAFLFWPDSTDAQAQANLRQLLHRLYHALPAADHFLRMDAKMVQWRPDAPYILDVAEFERHLAQADAAARTSDNTTVLAALQTAVTYYRGDLLPGCYDDWVVPERERWQAAFLNALEDVVIGKTVVKRSKKRIED